MNKCMQHKTDNDNFAVKPVEGQQHKKQDQVIKTDLVS